MVAKERDNGGDNTFCDYHMQMAEAVTGLCTSLKWHAKINFVALAIFVSLAGWFNVQLIDLRDKVTTQLLKMEYLEKSINDHIKEGKIEFKK